jgi:hypothetical protein
MKPYSGLFLVFVEPEHRSIVAKKIAGQGYFTFGLSRGDLHPQPGEVCFLSLDQTSITHACLGRARKENETGRVTLKFERLTDLHQIKPEEFEQWPALRKLVNDSFSRRASRLEPEDWEKLLDAIKSLRPAAAQRINELHELRRAVGEQKEQPGFHTMAQERDATRIALEIFGLEPGEIRNSLEISPPHEPAPFLQGLSAAKLREDPMIDHDAHVFPDFSDVRQFIQGSVQFTKAGERITVLNVNRAGIERALGVDLIYYNHSYAAYVMVQYKRLQQVPRDWVFNLNEKQFLEDLKRMDDFVTGNPVKECVAPKEYRLHSDCFYFKFCKNVTFEPMNCDMIDGMYFPRDYLLLLMASDTIKSSGGGKHLGYRNCLRHLNNSTFIAAVRGGWVGSRTKTTDVISEMVRKSIDAGRSAIVGIAHEETR